VLLVVVDTLRADYTGPYGFDADVTPNLDALASEAVVFERALAASSRTAPSHASMFSSRFVREHSVGAHNGSTRLEGVETLAQHFRRAGYATGAFVSNFVIRRRSGLDAGFDVYDDELTTAESNRGEILERRAPETTERALAWLAERDATRPVFLWVHYQDPHGPYTPADDALARIPELSTSGPDVVLPVLDSVEGRGGIPSYQALPGLARAGEYRRRYAGEIATVDAALGDLLAAFERRERPSIVSITADHGESLGEDGFYFVHGHGTTPELGHVPWILRGPEVPAGRRAELVHHVDLMPTLLELAGLPVPQTLRGRALGPALRGGAIPERSLFCDVGAEVALYSGDRIVRIQLGPGGRTRVAGFRWLDDGRWIRSAAPPALVEELADYLAESADPAPVAQPLSDADRERLRALGYVESSEAGGSEPIGDGP